MKWAFKVSVSKFENGRQKLDQVKMNHFLGARRRGHLARSEIEAKLHLEESQTRGTKYPSDACRKEPQNLPFFTPGLRAPGAVGNGRWAVCGDCGLQRSGEK
jgi:hypothetical protein